jgi:hypothetical protein
MTIYLQTRQLLNFLFFPVLISALSCGTSTEKKTEPEKQIQHVALVPGSICTVDNGDSTFGVVKVLVIDDQIAHLKIYKNKYSLRPTEIGIKTLSMGSINDKDGFGVGHVPIDRKGFDNWKPVIVGFEKVTKEDLEGYEIWRNQ